MPIKIPDTLPARGVLEGENIFVMTSSRALKQDIRPLRLVILNLMPTKMVTEAQLLRCLSNTPLQIEIELMQTATYSSKNTDPSHLVAHYTTFSEIRDRRYDGMIITGAPVELLPFERVAYWNELCEIMEWSKTNVTSAFHICWGAQAALFYHYGVPKTELAGKLFGVFEQSVEDPLCPLTRGFDDIFLAPHSRYTGVSAEAVAAVPELAVLSRGPRAGLYIAMSRGGRQVFVMGHSEYDAETLALEYRRDIEKGQDAALPVNYFPQDDPARTPQKTWRSHAQLLYSNWLNYYVYQTTPYDLENG
ncbi:MAG: homoserine O-succinyltransferase [Oscillospiraceae bacterium]|jgi:homoserine O-succinyltransferase|nr:homoserine O-succinyltransferase [Oscillospiraceae bacterium]